MTRSTLIALATFVALGVVYAATREPQVAVGIKKLKPAPVKADELVSLQVGALSLAKDGDAWKVTRDGKTFVADPNEVRPFAQALAELKADDFVTDKPEKHAELELDSAKGLPVKASTATGVVRELVLGKTSKSGGVYLREARSNEVYAAAGSLGWLARRELTQWRQKRIELAKREDLEKVTLTPAGGAPLVLLQTGTEVTLEGAAEPGYRFDSAAAARLVTQLGSLYAQDFSDEVVSPAFTLTLSLKGGGTRTVTLGAKRADGTAPLTVDGDPQTYLVSGWVADQLMKDREGLRSLQLLSVTPAEFERATLTAGGKRVVVEKKDGSWALVEPKTAPAGFDFDPDTVERQLIQLTTTRGTRIATGVTDAQAGLLRPVATLELKLKNGQTHRLAVGGKAEADVYAKGQDPFVLVAPASLLSTLEKGLELFKRPPPPPAMGGIQGLEQLPPELRAQLEAQLRQQR